MFFMKKSLLFLLGILFWMPTAAQTDQIGPTLTKAELISYLQSNYSVTNPLGYNGARDVMYGSIDNKDGNIIGVYTGFTITANTRGDAFAKGINTEHTWPQGLFDSNEPMRGDIHHLFPTRVEANSARSNYKFDEITDSQTTTWFFENQTQSSIPTSNIDAYSEYLSGTSFEPREDHKGNVARAIFYFWTIYQNRSNVSDDASFFNGMKDVLLAWHDLDPVDAAEVARSLGAEQAQGNRNPFVHDTTLVRRAYFEGVVVDPDAVPNPLIGEIDNIDASSFDVIYSDEGQSKTVIFRYDSNIITKDTAGNAFNLTDYEWIKEASVVWQDGASAEERIATEISVITFEDEPDTIIIGPTASIKALLISGIMDGTLTGGTPKAVELFATEDIPDLGVFGIGSANNGGGSDGVEFVLSGSLAKGEFIYVATEEVNFSTWFGFTPDFIDNFSVAVNGDDAVELFYDTTKTFAGSEVVVDIFGDINVDGTGQSWEYTDGWVYRIDFTGPDSTSFNSSNWTYSGIDELEGATSNADASTPFPIGTYKFELGTSIVSEFDKPNGIQLFQNYPNPFNPSTTISYSINESAFVSMKVYDMTGREVSTLVSENKTMGQHKVNFDASELSTGLYIYTLRVNEQYFTGKMLLIK